jgi:tetratricopeptide (TPR) repeat protein
MKIILFLLLLNLNLFSQLDKNYLNAKKNLELKNYEGALANFHKVINKKANYKDALNLRGLTYLYLQEFDSSLADFNKYIEYNPKSSDGYNNKGLALGYLNLADSARSSFDKAVLLDSKFPQPLVNIAFIYLNVYDNDSALIYFDKALAIDKNLPEVYFQKGKLLHSKKKYKESIENFKSAASKGYQKDECFLNIGNIYYKEKKFDLAIAEYSKAIKINDSKTEAINNRALSYDSIGNNKLAEIDRKRLKEINAPYIVDFSNVKYDNYTNADNSISVDLPKGWVKEEFKDSNTTTLTILPNDKNDSTKYFAKVIMSIERNMKKRFNVFTSPEMIDFWKGSSNENSKTYKTYDVFYEKNKTHKDIICLEFLTRFQINPSQPLIKQYEFTLYKEGVMFYAFFQCFEYQYQFFKNVFEKSISTIDVKM